MGNFTSKSQTNTSSIISEVVENRIENELKTAEVSFGEEAAVNCPPVEQTPLTKKIVTHFAQRELNQNAAAETPFHLMRKKILQDLGHADSIDPRSPSQRIPRTPLNIQKEVNEFDRDLSQCDGSPDDSCTAFNKKLADIMLDDCDENLPKRIYGTDEFRSDEPDKMFKNDMVAGKTSVGLTKHFDGSKIHLTTLNKRAVVSSRIPLSVINQRGITPTKKKSPDFKNDI